MKRIRCKLDLTDDNGGGAYFEFTVEHRTIIAAATVALLTGLFFYIKA